MEVDLDIYDLQRQPVNVLGHISCVIAITVIEMGVHCIPFAVESKKQFPSPL